MNLIEQLGGYEKANEVFLGNPETSTHYNLNSLGGHYAKEGVLKLNHRWQWFNTIDKQWYWDFSESNHIEIHDIKKALLEYRRQQNIYEVGDKVVIESYRNTYISCDRPSQYSIGDLMVIHNLDGNVISDDDYNFIDYRDVRHATPEEIKAGRRL